MPAPEIEKSPEPWHSACFIEECQEEMRRRENKETGGTTMRARLLPLVLLLLPACTAVDYQSPQFGEKAYGHQTIAILPFEMVFTGKMPTRLTPDQIAHIEEAESLAFQTAFYNRLLNQSSARKKHPIRIEIQPVELTNQILYDSGLDLRESWEVPPEELARILGVDAVVRTSVHKARYLSDLASYGIDLGLYVLYEATDGEAGWLVPPGLTKTHDIWADSVLVSAEDGHLLWKVAVERATDWHRPANDVVAGITKKLAKKFPYRG